MIGRKAAVSQVLRFANHPGFPKQEEREIDGNPQPTPGFEELVRAWRNASSNEVHAERIGDALMREARYCPLPADVYAAAEGLNASALPEWTGSDPSCSDCMDTGFTSRTDADGISVASVCECRKAAAK